MAVPIGSMGPEKEPALDPSPKPVAMVLSLAGTAFPGEECQPVLASRRVARGLFWIQVQSVTSVSGGQESILNGDAGAGRSGNTATMNSAFATLPPNDGQARLIATARQG